VSRTSAIDSHKFPSLYSKKLPSETLRHNPLTLTDLLSRRAAAQPETLAFTFLGDGEEVGETLTFRELHEQSLALAERLAAKHPPRSRAILLDPLGLDFFIGFFACLYAGLIPVPVNLPSRQRGMQQLRSVTFDCKAVCLLSSRPLLQKLSKLLETDLGVSALDQIAIDEAPAAPSPSWSPTVSSPTDLALLQYTSGTTGVPRGVMVTHANMLHNQQQIEHSFGHDRSTVVASWLPLFHDMGLGTALQGVWLGVHVVLMSPSAFVQRPVRWLAAVSRYRATFSGGPDFAYELCVRQVDLAECSNLDLSCWTGAFNGSEPVRPSTVERFISRFAPYGFPRAGHRPVYGLAEATLLVSAEGPGEPPVIRHFSTSAPDGNGKSTQGSQARVSCGRPWLGTRIVIVNPETLQICRPGREGEIWVGGQSVCAGYWEKPAESEATFRCRTADGDGPFLRTGDLGFMECGGLYITGRLKDLIIIRGENHYPQDIEATVSECHPSLEPQRCAAFAVEGEDGEQLVVVQEVKRTALRRLDADDVFRAIRGAVSRGHSLHTAAIVLIRPASLPRTSSGKVQRRLSARAFLTNSLAQVAAWAASGPGSTRDSRALAELDRSHAADRLIDWLRKNMPERVGWNRGGENTTIAQPLVLELGKQGLIGMQIDPRYGGLGLGHFDVTRVLEQLAAIDLSLCLFVGLNNALGLQPIAEHTTEDLKRSLLPRLVAGAAFAGFAFMEPGGGNSANTFTAIARAELNGRWRLFGTKCLHGQSQRATVVNVFVRHEDSPAVSAFVLAEDASGLHIANDGFPVSVVAGLAQDTVVLDGVLVDSSQLLGNVGTGMDVARQAMLRTRLAVGAACLGTMKRCAQLARRYSPYSARIQGKLTPNPVTLSRFGSLAARVTTLETFVYRIARAMDEQAVVPAEAFAVCKIAGPELLLRAADDLMQLGAQRGADEMQRLSTLYGQAGFLRTLDGPPEPVAELVGGLVMEGDGKALRELISVTCGAPDVVPMLDRVVSSLRLRLSRSPAALTRRAQRWSHTRAGELTTWIVLVAAVEGARRDTPTPELSRAATWARAQFEFALSTVELSTPSELAALEANDVADAFAAYARTIGDLEDDHSAGSPDAPPPMGYWESMSGIHAVPRTTRDTSAATESFSRAELTEFIVSWLSRRVRLPASKIDRSRSFADHGLDSMAAVELAKALSDKLGKILDETLLWNFATIDELLDHLETLNATRSSSEVVVGAPAATAAVDEPTGISRLDDEMAKLELELKRR
jgi:acyl-CoA synthetase (AMP-forming)/AMP-acid ligase II/alkylation response protein AidB-like acyl-CoA dehydrogenase/acyl carrier protein